MADFHLPGGGTLCELLVAERLAVPYSGERRDAIRELHKAELVGAGALVRSSGQPKRATVTLDHAVHCTKPLPVR